MSRNLLVCCDGTKPLLLPLTSVPVRVRPCGCPGCSPDLRPPTSALSNGCFLNPEPCPPFPLPPTRPKRDAGTWALQDLNLRPKDYESSALTN